MKNLLYISEARNIITTKRPTAVLLSCGTSNRPRFRSVNGPSSVASKVASPCRPGCGLRPPRGLVRSVAVSCVFGRSSLCFKGACSRVWLFRLAPLGPLMLSPVPALRLGSPGQLWRECLFGRDMPFLSSPLGAWGDIACLAGSSLALVAPLHYRSPKAAYLGAVTSYYDIGYPCGGSVLLSGTLVAGWRLVLLGRALSWPRRAASFGASRVRVPLQ